MSYRITKKGAFARMGFTLIELLVVIAIIGLLASIVLASLNSARLKSRDTRRTADIKQIQVALEFYLDGAGNGFYPVSTALTTAANCAQTGNTYGLEVLATNNYIPVIPRDPQSSTATPICYKYNTPSATPGTYHLAATLEDSGAQALKSKKNCKSDPAAGTSTCTSPGLSYVSALDGTVAKVFDVIP